MNYSKIYESLISNAQLEKRKKHEGIYYENHHIIPKSLAGSDSNENLVLLTAREHFIAHKLLLFINPKNNSLQRAFHMMCHSGNGGHVISPRDYEYSRELLRKMQSENRKGKNNPMYGRKVSEETRQKLSIAAKGKKHSEKSKEKMRQAKLGDLNPIYGRSSPNKGKSQPCSEEMKNKLRIAAKKVSKKECEYCHKFISPWNYAKWHGKNCKLNNIEI